MTAMKTIRATASVLLAALVLGACSDDGPSFPTSFDPIELQGDLNVAAGAVNAPAAASFAMLGGDIEFALSSAGMGPGVALMGAPSLLLNGPITPTAELKAMVARSADVQMANAVPESALGVTYVWSLELDEYVASEAAGAPSDGVRFALYAISPLTDRPAEPLNEIGYVDLTVTGGSTSAVARVEVWSEGVSATRVLDYSAFVTGGATTASVEVSGYAKNAQDSLAFTLSTGFSLETEALTIDWRTAMPSRGLNTRLIQTLSVGETNEFTIDAAIMSPSGRVDIDGTVTDIDGGELAVNVNGAAFATMTLSNSEDVEPTIVNADGEPLSPDEEETLARIFNWFSGAIELFVNLLAPVSALLEGPMN